jgi:hypothetical protein
MTTGKSVLSIGFDPTLLDFSSPELAPMQLTAEKVLAGLQAEEVRLRSHGYEVDTLLIDLGETAEAVIRRRLENKKFACVLIGAGIRINPKYLPIFEKIVNVVHEHAPQARLCFNTKPSDGLEAIQRWV